MSKGRGKKNQPNKKQKKKKADPSWKITEKVVAILEKALSPDARVRHDVKLPHIVTGDLIQCDVVIETGTSPRITQSIVEVQKRKGQVKPNDFRGWCQKMKDVGAQRLICVSARPFPKSIKNAVGQVIGQSVWLVTLKELETAQWPILIAGGIIGVCVPQIEVDSDSRPQVELGGKNPLSTSEATFNLAESVFRRDSGGSTLTLSELLKEAVNRLNDSPPVHRLPPGEHRITMRWEPHSTSIMLNGTPVPVRSMQIPYRIIIRRYPLPLTISSYLQEGSSTALAWSITAAGEIEGKSVSIAWALVPDGKGAFAIREPQMSGFKEGGYLFWGRDKESATK